MVNLKCGCSVEDDGSFVLGEHCKDKGCPECNAMIEIHPFGDKRLKDFM